MPTISQVKVLLRYRGKYLLLQKVRDIHAEHIGGWEVPGGKIKPAETAKQAALREVNEETGLDCKLITEFEPLQIEKNNFKTITRVFLAKTATIKSNFLKSILPIGGCRTRTWIK